MLKLLGLVEFRGQIGMVSAWMAKGSLLPYLNQNPEVDRCKLVSLLSSATYATMNIRYFHSQSARICAGLLYLHENQIVSGRMSVLLFFIYYVFQIHGDLKGVCA